MNSISNQNKNDWDTESPFVLDQLQELYHKSWLTASVCIRIRVPFLSKLNQHGEGKVNANWIQFKREWEASANVWCEPTLTESNDIGFYLCQHQASRVDKPRRSLGKTRLLVTYFCSCRRKGRRSLQWWNKTNCSPLRSEISDKATILQFQYHIIFKPNLLGYMLSEPTLALFYGVQFIFIRSQSSQSNWGIETNDWLKQPSPRVDWVRNEKRKGSSFWTESSFWDQN